ncbi:MAG: hypothetical protein US36_C0003G0025 [Candidatus Wolfebacteria bacterium GW2011_GWC1_37_10]|uniref:Uncharacterized protein n=2 Tax=Candidatus Wolfeibacteriota TaxID=1752735 RepID=A0A0G0J4N0_9BACT|nr:MAG: hypothetical protein US36_C0003G0025 [Candidatus Wolfebacteria bacterium GW2011_GWC1_37_10]
MGMFRNKFFILFLILTIGIYSLSAQTASAGSVVNFIVAAVVAVVVTVVTWGVGLSVVLPFVTPGAFSGIMAGLTLLVAGPTIGIGIAQCVVYNQNNVVIPGCDSSGSGAVIVSSQNMGCSYQIPSTFYNFPGTTYQEKIIDNVNQLDPSKSYYYTLPNGQPSYTDLSNVYKTKSRTSQQLPVVGLLAYDEAKALLSGTAYYPDYSGFIQGQTKIKEYPPVFAEVDESNRKINIYRFTLPVSASQEQLSNWFINDIQKNIGNGFISMNGGYKVDDYGGGYTSYTPGSTIYYKSSESTALAQSDYSTMCDTNNICRFTDTTAPEDSYIAYVTKVLGPYTGEEIFSGRSYNVDGDNKFLSTKSGFSEIKFPQPNNTDFGNGILGPYQTGVCPSASLDLKANNSDGPLTLYQPNTKVDLSWTSFAVSGCTASGDWSGDKSATGTESLGDLSRGTANPGQGKTYNFAASCTPVDVSEPVPDDDVSVTVWQYPTCSFTANPTAINLPETSKLSWSCQYADSCSIDNSVGNICSNQSQCASGSREVRPSETTNFTLNCKGLDGQINVSSTVNIGKTGTSTIKEVPPQ